MRRLRLRIPMLCTLAGLTIVFAGCALRADTRISDAVDELRKSRPGTPDDPEIAALARMGSAAVPALVASLKHPEAHVRERALRTLGALSVMARATPEFVEAMAPDQSGEYDASVSGWVYHPPSDQTDTVVPILSALLTDPDRQVRRAAEEALRRVGTVEALNSLEDADPR